MSKRAAQTQKKLFNIDLDSLLCDFSQEEPNDLQNSSNDSIKQAKKFKTKNNNPSTNKKNQALTQNPKEQNKKVETEELNDIEDVNDITTFFENVGNDFSKSMQVRKQKLNQFTEAVLSVYQSKITEMIKRQELEVDEFKEQAVSNIQKEMVKFEEECKKLKIQENKLMKILEQQLIAVQKLSAAQEKWISNFTKLHQNFLETYKELRSKHKNETTDLKKNIKCDVANLQKNFLTDSKREEMQTMKKYLANIYF